MRATLSKLHSIGGCRAAALRNEGSRHGKGRGLECRGPHSRIVMRGDKIEGDAAVAACRHKVLHVLQHRSRGPANT